MKKIFIETRSEQTAEYVFVSTLCEQLNITGYEIIKVGGWTNLTNRKRYLNEGTHQNLILFDADNNCQNRKTKLQSILNNLNAKADIFLFPNNQDKGAFENLLEKIAVDKKPLSCFEKYLNCLGTNYNNPDTKAKMYAYISSVKKNMDAIKKGKWDFTNTKYWNLDGQYIQPLIDFLSK